VPAVKTRKLQIITNDYIASLFEDSADKHAAN